MLAAEVKSDLVEVFNVSFFFKSLRAFINLTAVMQVAHVLTQRRAPLQITHDVFPHVLGHGRLQVLVLLLELQHLEPFEFFDARLALSDLTGP